LLRRGIAGDGVSRLLFFLPIFCGLYFLRSVN
jgi:hypothetical protein